MWITRAHPNWLRSQSMWTTRTIANPFRNGLMWITLARWADPEESAARPCSILLHRVCRHGAGAAQREHAIERHQGPGAHGFRHADRIHHVALGEILERPQEM